MAALEGRRVELAIREEPKSRSLPQNSYLHVLCKVLAEETGETLVRMKRLAVLSALGVEDGTARETLLGQEFLEVRRTSDLTKGEAAKVLDWLLQQCSFCGVTPPKPEHVEVMA